MNSNIESIENYALGLEAKFVAKDTHDVTFKCRKDFLIQGPNQARCLPNGSWNREIPKCLERCVNLGNIENIQASKTRPVSTNKRTINSTVELTCRLPKYEFKGPQKLNCKHGGWWAGNQKLEKADYPSCKGNYTDLLTAALSTVANIKRLLLDNNILQATFSKSDSIVINNRNDKTFVRWKSEQKSEYVDRIHNDPEGILTTVMNKLDELSVNNDATQNDINNIVLDISKNFKDAAAETFGKVNKHKHFYKHENSKPWFNRKCSMSRKKFHKARKRYSFLKNAENRSKMRQASKEHKITLNKSFANYQQRAADELRNISKKDTKALWKILNNLNDSKKR
ncbi:unnamed protein product [Mytilus edulis]|uniref:Sushi domain-containing protein n=1 Tax=Mytilus edulis TaxID=6550 RepID=A0A8S3U1L3_MYTED|nr:unnamed protein product [Mytilus edulis]